MTRRPRPASTPWPSPAAVLVTGALLTLGVLCIAVRIPLADALVASLTEGLAHGGAAGYADGSPPSPYPPFAAILFTPAVWLPPGVLRAVFVLGNAALLALLVVLSCRLAGLRARPVPVLAATIAGLWAEPLFQSLLPGQINLALACLAVWDLARPRAALGKGFALGTAAGTTLVPAVLVPYLLLTGRIRAGLTALAALAGTALLGLLVLPQASAAYGARLLGAGPERLLHWPHLWVWSIPLLAYATRAAALVRRPRAPAPGGQSSSAPAPAPSPLPASSSSASMIR
ncbi:glycosyltransferase 87 family protein [Streptomyces sp. NPDC046866]|uniref:glycosyltransferase 87 family protein n=1 Tax=Streptomyces sp. NPDC046866 TaxID=3154921 RepID=UPI003454101C